MNMSKIESCDDEKLFEVIKYLHDDVNLCYEQQTLQSNLGEASESMIENCKTS